MAIHVSRISKTEQIFTHEALDGTVRHFATERLFNYMKGAGHEVVHIAMDGGFIQTIMDRRGVEPHRIERIMAYPEAMAIPLLYLAHVTPGTHLLADGHHRYLIHHRIGSDYVPSYIAEPKLWNRFMVEGIPDSLTGSLLSGHSGIY